MQAGGKRLRRSGHAKRLPEIVSHVNGRAFECSHSGFTRFAFGTTDRRSGFRGSHAGYSNGMQDSDELPDDVPVADAVEQQRATTEPAFDEEASAEPPENVPLEATPADWQEQLETVELDPDEEMTDD